MTGGITAVNCVRCNIFDICAVPEITFPDAGCSLLSGSIPVQAPAAATHALEQTCGLDSNPLTAITLAEPFDSAAVLANRLDSREPSESLPGDISLAGFILQASTTAAQGMGQEIGANQLFIPAVTFTAPKEAVPMTLIGTLESHQAAKTLAGKILDISHFSFSPGRATAGRLH